MAALLGAVPVLVRVTPHDNMFGHAWLVVWALALILDPAMLVGLLGAHPAFVVAVNAALYAGGWYFWRTRREQARWLRWLVAMAVLAWVGVSGFFAWMGLTTMYGLMTNYFR